MCTKIYQRNIEQLRACSVNTVATFLDEAAQIDSKTHIPIIFKSDIDSCLCVVNSFIFCFISSHSITCRYLEAVPLANVHSRLRPCPPFDKRSIFGFGLCTDAAALQLPFDEHACRSLEQVCVGVCVCVCMN
jgi:hypothetical protein